MSFLRPFMHFVDCNLQVCCLISTSPSSVCAAWYLPLHPLCVLQPGGGCHVEWQGVVESPLAGLVVCEGGGGVQHLHLLTDLSPHHLAPVLSHPPGSISMSARVTRVTGVIRVTSVSRVTSFSRVTNVSRVTLSQGVTRVSCYLEGRLAANLLYFFCEVL